MKNLIVKALVLTILVMTGSCVENNQPTHKKIDLSNLDLKGILDYNTGITKETIDSDSSTLILNKVIKMADSISKLENKSSTYLRFYFKDNFLYASREPIDDDIIMRTGRRGNCSGVANWVHKETCHNELCVRSFIGKMNELYSGCFAVCVEKNLISATVYGRPCSVRERRGR